jgi:hypothetical protein
LNLSGEAKRITQRFIVVEKGHIPTIACMETEQLCMNRINMRIIDDSGAVILCDVSRVIS